MIPKAIIPGEIVPAASAAGEVLTLNAGRPTLELDVANQGDRPIQVGSHYHFCEANEALVFYEVETKQVMDRKIAWGYRLDIPAGSARRFEPGKTVEKVRLVAYAGKGVVIGFQGDVQSPVDKMEA